MKLNKILLTTCALPIAVTPAISIASCAKAKQEQVTLTISGKPIVDINSITEIKYIAKDSTGKEVTCKWSADNTNIATIDENTGVLTPVAKGIVKITAKAVSDEKLTAQLAVTITDQWTPFAAAWEEALARFKTTKGKYKTATLDPSSRIEGKTVKSPATINYLNEQLIVQKHYCAQLLIETLNIYMLMAPDLSNLEEMIISSLLISTNPSLTLINNVNEIGFEIKADDTLFKMIADKNLYWKECWTKVSLEGTEIEYHTIITQYNES